MKVKISRSFSKKVQLKQFEPIESFCAVEAEVEITSHQSELSDSTTLGIVSEQLDNLCRSEVEKTLKKFAPKEKVCLSCGGVSNVEPIGADGLHASCRKVEGYKQKQL